MKMNVKSKVKDSSIYSTISIKPSTKKRFAIKFKEYGETDEDAMLRLLKIAGVEQ